MVQNATILNDVTVDHSNITVASVNCKQSISTHCDQINHDGCGDQAICVVNHENCDEQVLCENQGCMNQALTEQNICSVNPENHPTGWRQAGELPEDPLLNPESAATQDDLWISF